MRKSGRPLGQWIASDWVEVDDEGNREATRQALQSSQPGTFFGDCLAEKRVILCEGARVILLHNLDLDADGELKLCNGSLSVVGPPPTPDRWRWRSGSPSCKWASSASRTSCDSPPSATATRCSRARTSTSCQQRLMRWVEAGELAPHP